MVRPLELVPVNLTFTPSETNSYVVDSPNFFPIDGKGWNDESHGHNYWFTLEFHHSFIYQGGEEFSFRGDDDMWVFINGTLALDLGGVHTELTEKVELDHLGLTTGEPVSLDVFYAERHTVGAHFRIETTIRLDQAVNEDLWLTIAKWPVQRLLLLVLLLPLLFALAVPGSISRWEVPLLVFTHIEANEISTDADSIRLQTPGANVRLFEKSMFGLCLSTSLACRPDSSGH